jgi:cold shock CspA family protein
MTASGVAQRGFGFVADELADRERFFHVKTFRGGFGVVPAAGMRVTFETEFDPQRANDRAVNVTPL